MPRTNDPRAAPRRPRASSLPLPLIESKLHPPALREGTVSRSAVIERIRAQAGAAVVTITAPAGYGKTTLLREWAGLDDRPFAWLSLDAKDDAATTLLSYVACA